ncbi:hypothetical protein EJC49_19535 [Aquibium carbonis]|uniref:Uncharacterized protein n=1 Tax=Aquibium carbonis TaxID=2495581 RepID=A0A429YTE3_9HYPH|nr:hypothetical protein EJC49_19535 [Aquibium carbonis]
MVRCKGEPAFRSQLARDAGCLLDLDDDVDAWSCLPLALGGDEYQHLPDFHVRRGDRHTLLDVGPAPPPDWAAREASERGYDYHHWTSLEVRRGHRLGNAKDLLRYARWRCALGDRIRLLAGLEESGTLTVAECLPAFRETLPIAGLASLVLHRFLAVELDEAPIGPSTIVRQFSR